MDLRHINHLTQQWAPLRNKLKDRRREMGVSQEQLVNDTGLGGITTIGRIERGESTPGVDTVLVLAEALDLELALVDRVDARLLHLDHHEIVAMVRAVEIALGDPLLLPTGLRQTLATALEKLQGGSAW